MKHKRVWTDEERAAASERMRVMQANRRAAKQTPPPIDNEHVAEGAEQFSTETTSANTAVMDRPPEVQAVLDSMPADRKAKLASIQAGTLANLSQTKEGREALDRMEARHSPTVAQASVAEPQPTPMTVTPVTPPKPIVREVPMKVPFRITGSISGMCVSEVGACQCGAPKLKWHPICLKVRV